MTTSEQTSTIKVSEKASTIKDSITMAISALAKKMKSEGQDVLSFSAGEPDFDTPQHIKDAGIKSINDGKTKYTPASGIADLKTTICEKLKLDHDLDYSPKNIVVSCGAKHSLYNVMLSILNDGDEVIVPKPYWVSYPYQISMAGGIPIYVETTDKNAFKLTAEQLESTVTPNTKAIILTSPSNPTGSVYSKEELEALGKVIVKHNLIVISDEIYEKLIYDNKKHVSIASLSPELKSLTILVNGVSKAYSMTGWRIGYFAAEEQVATAAGRIQSHSTSNPAAPSQWASIEAIKNGETDVKDMIGEFENRRNTMVDGLNAIENISCVKPDGAFYVFPNVSQCFGKSSTLGVISNSVEFCEHLLKEQLVACVPGSGFGTDDYVRLSYATGMDDIQKGIERISQFVNSLK